MNVIMTDMGRLKDEYISKIPIGSLVYPSSSARKGGQSGNYYLEDVMGFFPDFKIFPAIIIPSHCMTYVKILTPTGVHTVSEFALVSYVKQ